MHLSTHTLGLHTAPSSSIRTCQYGAPPYSHLPPTPQPARASGKRQFAKKGARAALQQNTQTAASIGYRRPHASSCMQNSIQFYCLLPLTYTEEKAYENCSGWLQRKEIYLRIVLSFSPPSKSAGCGVRQVVIRRCTCRLPLHSSLLDGEDTGKCPEQSKWIDVPTL